MITARQIEEARFSKPPIGKRGYNEDEVDAFLDIVAPDVAEYERIAADYDNLQDELERLRNQPQAVAAPPPFMPPAPPPPPAPEPPSAQAARILELAESTAQTLTEEAQREADHLRESARTEADRLRETAQSEANEITAGARYEAKKLLDGARQEVETLTRQIGELREFERNYRGRLDVYIESQLAALRSDGFIEPQS